MSSLTDRAYAAVAVDHNPRPASPAYLLSELSRAIGLVGAGNVVAAATTALTSLYLARSLSLDELGRLAYGMNVYLVATLIGGLGLTTAVVEATSRTSRTAPSEARKIVAELLAFRLGSATACSLALVAAGAVWSSQMLVAAGMAAGLSLTMDFLGGVFQGQRRTPWIVITAMGQPTCFLGALLFMGPARSSEALELFALSFIPVLVVLAAAVGFTRAHWIRPRFDRTSLRQLRLSSTSTGAYMVTFLQVGYFSFGPLMLGMTGRFIEAGILSVMLALIRLVPSLWGSVVAAVIYPRLVGTNNEQDRSQLLRGALRALLLVAVPPAIWLGCFPEVVLDTVFGHRFVTAASEMRSASVLVSALCVESLLTWGAFAERQIAIAVIGLTTRLAGLVVGLTVLITGLLPGVDDLSLVTTSLIWGGLGSLAVQGFLCRRSWRYAEAIKPLLLVVAINASLVAVVRTATGTLPIHAQPITLPMAGGVVGLAATAGLLYRMFATDQSGLKVSRAPETGIPRGEPTELA